MLSSLLIRTSFRVIKVWILNYKRPLILNFNLPLFFWEVTKFSSLSETELFWFFFLVNLDCDNKSSSVEKTTFLCYLLYQIIWHLTTGPQNSHLNIFINVFFFPVKRLEHINMSLFKLTCFYIAYSKKDIGLIRL